MLPVVLLSHRGPASFRRTSSGLEVKRGAGGLVTALMGLAEHLDDAVWVCAAATEVDAAVAAEHEGPSIEISFSPEPQVVPDDEPAAGLDLGGREALLRTLTRLAQDPTAPAMVLVSHHVEEVPAGFTHGLLLRDGGIVAAGRLTDVMTSAHLSACFGLPLRVHRHGDRYTAKAALLRLP